VPLDALTSWVISCLLLGLRIGPVFAFAPPFTLIRLPRTFRVLLGLGLSACLVNAMPETTAWTNPDLSAVFIAAVRELMLGLVFVLAFQIAFGALYVAGRTIDIQSGYGLALLVDPTSRTQTPLVGTLFAYAAGAVFFAMDGHLELFRLLAASLEAVPIGGWEMPHSVDRIAAFMSIAFLIAFGVAGAAVLALFLTDLIVAMMSRTMPQMNVLILGIQVKSIVLLLVLPITLGLGGALLIRLMATTLRVVPELF
jgi:flagellar biosynthesis protein FliR